jgi:hypothetical protein
VVLVGTVPKEGLDQFGWQGSEAARSRREAGKMSKNKEGIDRKQKTKDVRTSEGPMGKEREERITGGHLG